VEPLPQRLHGRWRHIFIFFGLEQAQSLNIQFLIFNLQLTPSGTGHGFAQNRVDFIEQFTFGAAFREGCPVDALFAGAFYQIPDFEIVFIFETFFCHFSKAVSRNFW
jgi:hypothetical protein